MLSRNLEQTLHRALGLAQERRHEYATLEHLLLALTDDQDSSTVLRACGVDLEKLKRDLTEFLDKDLAGLVTERAGDPKPTAGFQRVVQRAAIHVQSSGRDEVTGANVLVALFFERESHAVYFLQLQDMTRLDAVNFISHGIAKAPGRSQSRPVQGTPADREEQSEKEEKPRGGQGGGRGQDALSNYCVNLNKKAQQGKIDPLIGREPENQPGSILFIDEIHTVIGAGATSGGAMDASNLLKPALAQGTLRGIGSTTYKEYRNYFEKDRALVRRFQKIDVNEPTVEDAVKILQGLKTNYERHHKVRYTPEAIRGAVELSSKYIHDRKLPDKAIDVIDEVGASRMLLPENRRRKTVTLKDVEEIVAKIARIPPKSVSNDDKETLRNLERDLKSMVFGQEQAIDALSAAIKLSRAGLRDAEKPIGNYLFSGPTGVGKTEVAKQLAKTLGIELIRFDMSEYMERHSVSRLIGAPPGYVGFDQGGMLTDAIDQHPHCVLLLDEIEKAHQDLYNILLQVMDHGKLTDHNGKTVDFRNVILIMTTNAGAADMAKPAIGFGSSVRIGEDEEAIKRMFTPEFRNRLDAVVPFAGLTPEIVGRVVEKFVMQLEAQLADRNVTIELSSAAKEWLAERGYDPLYGARPLARVIQEHVKKPLAEELLFGRLAKGGAVKVGLKDGALAFDYIEAAPPALPKPEEGGPGDGEAEREPE